MKAMRHKTWLINFTYNNGRAIYSIKYPMDKITKMSLYYLQDLIGQK